MTKRTKAQPARGTLVWLTIQDSPPEGHSYLSAEELRVHIEGAFDWLAGVRVTRFKAQPLPRPEKRSAKGAKVVEIPPQSGDSR